jgi:hypothetical protein
MLKVYSHENLTILYSAKNLLELNNIICFVKNEHYASGGHVGLSTIPVELWVADADDASKALTILEQELGNSRQIPSWQCTNCGEENDGSFETCWKCQRSTGP